jgi:hypothetical protein
VPALNTAAIAPITTPLPPNSVAGEKCGLVLSLKAREARRFWLCGKIWAPSRQ